MRQLIDQRLEKLLGQHGSLSEAARYAVLGGGKRLRPLLVLLVAEALGAAPSDALDAACAIEMVHAYSLIHDDLPCMDDDDFRRGKPTLHRAYSEGLAVLTGDFLLTHAFHVISHSQTLDDSQKAELTRLLSHAAGAHGMIYGQVLDLENIVHTSVETLQRLHMLKTGSLLSAAAEAGAIVAKADENTKGALRSFGMQFGVAFQIMDDVLDVTDSAAKHGRQISSDEVNQKVTYVTLLGVEGARRDAMELAALAKNLLIECGIHSPQLVAMIEGLAKKC